MNKLMMVAIGMVACSMVTGCMSQAVTKGGTYANLPDPEPDEYQIHWEHKADKIKMDATVSRIFGFYIGDNAPWMLRDAESRSFFGLVRNYTIESRARNAALYKACQQEKCDALIGAMYKVDNEDWFVYSKSKCTVEGWPASITGIEKVSNKVK